MNAIVLHGPGRYSYEKDWPLPEVDGWALVKVSHCGICGSDLPRYASKGSYRAPMILGHEFSGVVESPDRGSTFQKGDPVAILPLIPCGTCEACKVGESFHCISYGFLGSRNDGGMAEYCAVPPQNLVRLPSRSLLLQGSLLEPLAVGQHVADRSGFTSGCSAIIYGAGPIGILTALWLKESGASRIALADIREKNLDRARCMGFEDVFNPMTQDPDPKFKFDFAYEAAGSGKAVADAIHYLKHKGVLTVVGRDTKDTVLPVSLFELLMRKELTLLGCWGYGPTSGIGRIVDLIERYRKELLELITTNVPPEDACRTIASMIDGTLDYAKVVVSFGDDNGKARGDND